MKRFYWNGISIDERTKAISEITILVDKYAAISNFQRFSDISLSLVLEIEECKINDLYVDLDKIMIIDGFNPNITDSTADCIILFSITFSKSTGDLTIEVPDIPE
jgi:hypothetical protein